MEALYILVLVAVTHGGAIEAGQGKQPVSEQKCETAAVEDKATLMSSGKYRVVAHLCMPAGE